MIRISAFQPLLSILYGFVFVHFLLGSQVVFSQCTTVVSQSIPDEDSLVVEFIISGLSDIDLASPTQGICGVEIDFMHEYIGDLTVTLISPSGQSVVLVGPNSTVSSNTNLIRWDVGFIPCMSSPMPDGGFAPVWSNNQSWELFPLYDGTYHPNAGCLEDFNLGSANGFWQIIFEDHDEFQLGSVAEATLIFCNSAGLLCNACEPNAGILSPSSFQLCEGDNLSASSITIEYGGNPPPASLYAYTYVMTSGNTIINSGPSFSLTPVPGNYTICGISYLQNDSTQLNNLISTGDYNQLQSVINSGSICGQISNCIPVQVATIPDTVFVDHLLCAGESFLYRGQTYSMPGIFYETVNGAGDCDSIYKISIQQSQLVVSIETPDTLTCAKGSVQITSNVFNSIGSVSYSWSTASGNILGSSTLPDINVNQPAQYIIEVADQFCEASASVNVIADDAYPKIFLDGGIITCAQPTVPISPIYIPSDAGVVWTGPFGFTSFLPDINVTIPGNYIFRVTNEIGCSISRAIDIAIDTATHELEIVVNKDCQNQTARLTLLDASGIVSYLWTGPNGFSSTGNNAVISDPGLYLLNTTFFNSCQRNASYFFDGDFLIPDIFGPSADTLNCNEQIPLLLTSSTPGVSYNWSGPNGFITNAAFITVTEAGTYYGTVYSVNGCLSQVQVPIVQGNDIFPFQIISDTLTCRDDTIQIGVIAPDADLFHWLNYSGADSASSLITITDPGLYMLMMVDTHSGCTITSSIVVPSDFIYPSFGYTSETITCDNPVADLSIVVFNEYPVETMYWVLPDASVVQGPTLSSSQPGEHLLIGTSPAGCIGIYRIHIPFDTIPPLFFVEDDTIGCDRQGVINSIAIDPLTSISWIGPGGFTSNDFDPMISDTGIYVATGIAINGCTSGVTVHVAGDFLAPASLLSLEELTCLQPTADLVVQSPDSILSYEWRDETGNIIGTDSLLTISSPGVYTIQIEGDNHCLTTDTIPVISPDYPSIETSVDTLTCADDTIQIIASSDIADPAFVWLNLAGDTLSKIESVEIDYTGPFVISITAPNGCERKDTVLVPTDTTLPVAVINMIGEVRCQFRDFMLNGANSIPSNVTFDWTTIGGMILSNSGLSIVNATDTGRYYLTVTNPGNGCSKVDSLIVGEHPDAITGIELNIQRPKCAGDSNAVLTIVNVSGGVPQLLYTLNNGVPQTGLDFSALSPGTHLLEITDQVGCIFDTSVLILPTNDYMVDAGLDQEIFIGGTATLIGITDIVPDEVLTQAWNSGGVSLCNDCLEVNVSPQVSTTYTFTVTSQTGCVISDEVEVFVIEKAKFFIPNAFTPNGDGFNDEIRLYSSPGITKVLKWIIFDRWGDAVFGRTDFDPGDPSVFWDGYTLGSEKLNPGVFPYVIEVELLNGNREVHHGTITLIR